jgi:O-antigen/teichoic acid export membrane protein
MSLIYAIVPFLNTLILFAFETAYFRFMQRKEFKQDVYDTLSTSLLISTGVITGGMIFFREPLADFIGLSNHPGYVTLSAMIIGFDALVALPFAKLRHDNRPRKYAVIQITRILVNIGLVYFFLTICPAIIKKNQNSVLHFLYNARYGVAYVLLANAAASIFAFVALFKEWSNIKLRINKILWKEVIIYALPLTVAGFAGMINETFDRVMLQRWSPLKGDAATFEVGIYSACYKLSILITLFVQAFRMGAEPFFFKQSTEENAPRVYARVMKFFVLTICCMFLVVALYLEVWKTLFIRDEKMWEGLRVVPILLFANMFLGIYYNLSIWYRLSHKTTAGAYITLIGAGITLFVNFIFIPYFGYMACAWATFLCYGAMMVISYIWGQKSYPVPYAWKKLLSYMVIVAIFYFVHHGIVQIWHSQILSLTIATLLLLLFGLFIYRIERKEMDNLLKSVMKISIFRRL